MSFIEAIKSCLSQYVGFKGRATRSEYWFFTLFTGIVSSVFTGLAKATGANFFNILGIIFCLAILLPGLAVTVRRLQDMGRTWPSIFFSFIPIVGTILLIVWCCKDSVPGENEFGPNPKGVN